MNRRASTMFLGATCAALAACGVAPLQAVKVPVPVECRVETPARPAMPTEVLRPGADPDRFVAAVQAEIELREGYEGELLAALEQCTTAVRKKAPAARTRALGPGV